MNALILSILLASPPDAESTTAVIVPGVTTLVKTEETEKPIICPPGRFIVILPNDDRPLSYFPSGSVQKYPLGAVIVGVKWDELPNAKPKPYTFPNAKGHIGFLMPDNDVTINVARNGSGTGIDGGPEIVQTIEVKTGTAPQPPPVPPNPPNPPQPPPPEPDPNAPFTGVNGLHVLIVINRSAARPQEQQSIISGVAVSEYLRKHTANEVNPEQGTDGKAYRIYPHNADISRAPKVWADAFKLKKGDDWVLIGDGKRGESVPLPQNERDMLTLLKKYGN